MTAQITDRIRIDGQESALFTEPLQPLLAERNLRFASPHTALWRGYIAYWEIADGKLFLVAFQGHSVAPTPSDKNESPQSTAARGRRSSFDVTLENLFPDSHGRELAEWFTGTLRIPQGEMIEYVHMGYESVYPSYLCIEIDCGTVTATRIEKTP